MPSVTDEKMITDDKNEPKQLFARELKRTIKLYKVEGIWGIIVSRLIYKQPHLYCHIGAFILVKVTHNTKENIVPVSCSHTLQLIFFTGKT